jgi:hypothetical protein
MSRHGMNRQLIREQVRSFKEDWQLIPWPPRDDDDDYDEMDAMWMDDMEGSDDEATYH